MLYPPPFSHAPYLQPVSIDSLINCPKCAESLRNLVIYLKQATAMTDRGKGEEKIPLKSAFYGSNGAPLTTAVLWRELVLASCEMAQHPARQLGNAYFM